MTRVKICGLTRPEDASLADLLGADAVGFVFAPSPRQIDVASAYQLSRQLSPFTARVGVFVDPTPADVAGVLDRVRLDVVQLHGDESPQSVAAIRALGVRVVKAVRVRSEVSVAHLAAYGADAYLLDTYVPGVAGGTGKSFQWELAKDAARSLPIILAGGLTPGNVLAALQVVQPHGVDVSSGVESSPGVKDPTRLRQFIARVRRNDVEAGSGAFR